ncbi:MAG TPA: hypothetical protein VH374_15675 [Polyangia bacterium]|nr:hypothetical protein [Polyangia bacterium]
MRDRGLRSAPFAATSLARLCLCSVLGLAASASALSCAQKTEAPSVCCDQPKFPPGIPAFTVVTDDSTGPSDGQDVRIKVALRQKTSRDNLYKSMQFLYRYAMTRRSFEPTTFTGQFFTTEGEAQSGANPVAKIWRDRSDQGPKCENGVALDFGEQIDKAFAYSLNRAEPEDLADTCHLSQKKAQPRFDEKFTHKAIYKIDPAHHAAEVNYPYLETGKDEYAKSLTFNAAMTYWAEFTNTMFSKAPELAELTYNGILDDQPVLKITVTRQEFDSKLSTVQETIASYAAITFAKLGLHKTDDKGALKDQEQQKTKTYKAALSFLPKNRVFVSPKLKT